MLSFVDTKRKEKAERFINEKDRLLCLGAGYLEKKYLPNEQFKYTSNGKPYLEDGPKFNISHSGEYVVLTIHPSREIGVDIERIDEKKMDAIRFILLEEEKDITDINSLFEIWSNKESLIKCISTGLKDIRHVKGLPKEGIRVVESKEYYVKSMTSQGYSLSIALEGKEQFDLNIKNITSLE